MVKQVLILGGRGRIGRSVAADLATHTEAKMTLTGRTANSTKAWKAELGDDTDFLVLDLDDRERLQMAIASADLVIHCAGPFRYRDANVLKTCIDKGTDYLDVSDDRHFTRTALDHREAALSAGVTAIVNSGVFPGISNSMVRQGVEQMDSAELIHLSYVVSGSGGAGVTVMKTTFLGLQYPFEVWLNGRWQTVEPYTGREVVEFPAPFGRMGVYWFDMPEAITLADSFPVETVMVKFGSAPDFYNHLTSIVAHWFPTKLMQHPSTIAFLAQVSHKMTSLTDRFSGIGVAMRAEITGQKAGRPARYYANFVHEQTAAAVGCGTGSLAQLMLSEQLKKPGVWAVEQALPTDLFEQTMHSRGIAIHQRWLYDSLNN